LATLTYRNAIKQDPNDLELKGFLGTLLYQTKKYEEAIEVLGEVLVNADPQSKEYNDALYNLAYSYDLMGRSDKAIEAYQTALSTAPNDKDLMFNMGRLYFMQNNFEKAIETFSAVIAMDPDDFDANLNVGNAYLSIADSLSGESRKIDDQGNSIHPQTKIDELESQSKGFFEKAVPFLKKATEIKPDNINAWRMLGIAYVRIGDAEKGQEAFDKADELEK